MFCAEKGNGAYFNNSRIRVSNKKKLKDAIACYWWSKTFIVKKEEIFQEYINISKHIDAPIRKFGSAALDMLMLLVEDLMVIGKEN